MPPKKSTSQPILPTSGINNPNPWVVPAQPGVVTIRKLSERGPDPFDPDEDAQQDAHSAARIAQLSHGSGEAMELFKKIHIAWVNRQLDTGQERYMTRAEVTPVFEAAERAKKAHDAAVAAHIRAEEKAAEEAREVEEREAEAQRIIDAAAERFFDEFAQTANSAPLPPSQSLAQASTSSASTAPPTVNPQNPVAAATSMGRDHRAAAVEANRLRMSPTSGFKPAPAGSRRRGEHTKGDYAESPASEPEL